MNTQTHDISHGIAKTQYSSLTTKLKSVLDEFYRDQTELREERKHQLKLEYQNMNEDELEDLLREENPTLFTYGVLATAQKSTEKNLEERHVQFLELEDSLSQLHQLFVELQNMVENQGQVISRIECHTDNSSINIQSAKDEIRQALKLKNRARKKKIAIGAGLVVIAIICIPFGF